METQLLPPRYDFRKRKSKIKSRYEEEKRYICSSCSHITIFASKIGKLGQDAWDRKAPTAAAAPTIQFLWAKRREIPAAATPTVRLLRAKRRHQVKMWGGKETPAAATLTVRRDLLSNLYTMSAATLWYNFCGQTSEISLIHLNHEAQCASEKSVAVKPLHCDHCIMTIALWPSHCDHPKIRPKMTVTTAQKRQHDSLKMTITTAPKDYWKWPL